MADRPPPAYQPDAHGSDTPWQPTPDQAIFNQPLLPPSAPYLAPSVGTQTPRDSYLTNNSVGNSAQLLDGVGDKELAGPTNRAAKKSGPLHKKPLIWVLAAAAVALIAVAVVVPVYFTVIRPKNNTVSGGSDGGSSGGFPSDPTPTHSPPSSSNSGGNGTTIKAADGTEFTYINNFGGICALTVNFLPPLLLKISSGVSDPNDPFNDDAYPNSWTPPLNASWTWGQNKLYGYVRLSCARCDTLTGNRRIIQSQPWRLVCPRTFHHSDAVPKISTLRRR